MENLYSKIGPERLHAIIDRFYDLVFQNEKIAQLFQTNKSLIRDKQYKFLTQFLGGPQLYSNEYGHPRMRMRHLPHAITQEAKEEWLACMREAIDSEIEEKELADALYNCFPKLADHMVNS